jgi:hypothetical protein
MMAFSTVLFVDGNPVGYKAYLEQRNHLILNPAENPNREVDPPVLQAIHEAGAWHVQGTQNQDLIEQVIEDVEKNLRFNLYQYKAAP